MNILVINCGSSSLKYQLLDMETKGTVAKGLVERIGMSGAVLTHRNAADEKEVITAEIPNHTVAVRLVLDALVNPNYGAIKDLNEIGAVGHRVLHGKDLFSQPVLVNDEVMKAIVDCIELGPLHNPANIAGIEACQKLMPGVPQVAVFDTAFHQTMPPQAYLYGIPYELYEKYKIRRYGFHGTSHKYVSQRAAAVLNRPIEDLKLISCHLGNGASVTAIQGGKSVDTSMGFTPLEGLVMGTRSGDLDPAIVSFIMQKENLTSEQVSEFLNKKCGVLGLSGVSSDFRDLDDAAEKGNSRAQLTLDVFAHKVRKYIGSYAAVMNGVDAIIFTAGLGENSIGMRAKIIEGLDYLGAEIDPEKNNTRGKEVDVSTEDARCRVLVIPTNEELMIAMDTYAIVNKG